MGLAWDEGKSLSRDLLLVSSTRGGESLEVAGIEVDGTATDPSAATASSTVANGMAERQRELADLLARTVHVPSQRPTLERTYEARQAEKFSAEEAPFLLAGDSELRTHVEEWFVSTSDRYQLDVDRAGLAHFRLTGGDACGLPVNLRDSGRGTQSLLPVVTVLTGVARQLCRKI